MYEKHKRMVNIRINEAQRMFLKQHSIVPVIRNYFSITSRFNLPRLRE